MIVRPGTLFGSRFEVDRLIASGGMGLIYRAKDRLSGQFVALKLLLHEEAASGPDAERFIREAQLLSQLRHPCIVGYITHGQTLEGQLYLATEWLDGEDLASRLATRGLTLAESVACIRCAAAGLQAAHERGIVHRDIKPGNLFLRDCRAERTTLLDFGIARPDLLTQALTATGIAIGTPNFMAPEQARGERTVGPAADIFSLGCVLFQCLTGGLPFFADQPIAVLTKILAEEAPSVLMFRPDLPLGIDALVKRMLHKDPQKRPQHGAELLAALDALGNSIVTDGGLGGPAAPDANTDGDDQKLLCVIVGTLAAPTQEEVAPNADADDDENLPTRSIQVGELALSVADSTLRAAIAAIAQSFDAPAKWLADGSLIVTLVGKGSATDLVQSAGRCALAIARAWPDAQVAMATGRGIVTQQLPVGDAIDRAFQLVRSRARTPAPLHDTLVNTKPDSSPSIWLDDVSTGLLNGCYQLARPNDGPTMLVGEFGSDEGRRLLGKPTPCVGRDQELNLLNALLASCLEDSEAHAVLVLAADGIGKSRLKHEFLRRLQVRSQTSLILLATGDMQNPGVPYSLLGQALRRLCGMQEGLPAAEQCERVSVYFGQQVDASHRRFVCEFLGELCGVHFPAEDSPQLHAARLDPRLMNDQIERAFTTFLSAQCRKGAVVVVLDDLHWGDSQSVQLMDSTLRELRSQPLLLLGLGRPEVAQRFPRIWESHKLQQLPLKGLSKRACQRLIEHVLGPDVDRTVMARMLEQAGGNALFVEELIRMVGENRIGVIPDSVLAMVQIRLCELPLRLRRVLLAGSVYGPAFWGSGLEAVVAASVEPGALELELGELAHAEFIERQSSSRYADEIEYSFCNPIVREAAYALLTDDRRKLAHRLAAGWLQRVGESDSMILAVHSELGGLPELAASHYHRAAELALERNALEDAIATARRGQACGASGQRLGMLISVEAIANIWLWRMDEFMQLAPLGEKLLPPESSYRFILTAFQLYGHLMAGRLSTATQLVHTMTAAEPASGDHSLYIKYCMMVAIAAVPFGVREISDLLIARVKQACQTTASLDTNVAAIFSHGCADYTRAFGRDLWQTLILSREAAEGHKAAGDRKMMISARIRIGQAACELGNAELGIRVLRESLALAESDHDLFYRRQVMLHLSAALAALPDAAAWEQAEAYARDVLEIPNTSTGYKGWAHGILAQCCLQRHQASQAEVEANLALPQCQNFPLRRLWVKTLLASCKIIQGRATIEAAQELIAELDDLKCAGYVEVAARLAAAEQFAAAGQSGRAHRELRATLEQIALRADLIPEPEWRERYLNQVGENLRARQLAEKWLATDPWKSDPAPLSGSALGASQ